eukprot:332429_1
MGDASNATVLVMLAVEPCTLHAILGDFFVAPWSFYPIYIFLRSCLRGLYGITEHVRNMLGMCTCFKGRHDESRSHGADVCEKQGRDGFSLGYGCDERMVR